MEDRGRTVAQAEGGHSLGYRFLKVYTPWSTLTLQSFYFILFNPQTILR